MVCVPYDSNRTPSPWTTTALSGQAQRPCPLRQRQARQTGAACPHAVDGERHLIRSVQWPMIVATCALRHIPVQVLVAHLVVRPHIAPFQP